jgi:hypothetical protein
MQKEKFVMIHVSLLVICSRACNDTIHSDGLQKYTRPIYTLLINTIANNVSILLAWLSAGGKEVVLYLVARNTL